MAKRQIPCPYCTGDVLQEENGRTTSNASLFPRLQNFLTALIDFITTLAGGTTTVSRKEAIGGKCEACKGKGTIEDPTDTSSRDKKRADFLVKNNNLIESLLAKLGRSPGGSRITRVAGNEVLVVGHVLNTAKSYTTKEGVGGPGDKVVADTGKGRAAVDRGTDEHKVVVGNNVPANSGGGAYIIQCGNRFHLMAGSQGISIKSTGPVEIDGSLVSFTGADMTFGTNVGQTSIAGNHVVVQGTNVSMKATGKSGQIGIEGSLGVTGNMQAGGAYVDNMFCSKMTMPAKQVSTKAGTGTRLMTGPATWTATSPSAIINALDELKDFALERITDMDLLKAGGPQTPRFQFNLSDCITNIGYLGLPVEPQITGVCITTLGGPGIVFNFPHTHIMPDGVHTHNTTVPAINYEQHETAESVRAAFAAGGGNSPVAATAPSGDFLGSLLKGFAQVGGSGLQLLASGRKLLGFGAAKA
jgi:hypothetical protein